MSAPQQTNDGNNSAESGPKGVAHEWNAVRTLVPYLWPRGETETKIREAMTHAGLIN